MMITTKGASGNAPVYKTANHTAAQVNTKMSAQMPEKLYDQVSLSKLPQGEQDFRKQMVSRLVGQVRTAHTTGDIQRIKDDVTAGTYKPDATEIAAKLLLEENTIGNS